MMTFSQLMQSVKAGDLRTSEKLLREMAHVKGLLEFNTTEAFTICKAIIVYCQSLNSNAEHVRKFLESDHAWLVGGILGCLSEEIAANCTAAAAPDIQSLMLDCMPHAEAEVLLNLAISTIRLTKCQIPEEPQQHDSAWKDEIEGVQSACRALDAMVKYAQERKVTIGADLFREISSLASGSIKANLSLSTWYLLKAFFGGIFCVLGCAKKKETVQLLAILKVAATSSLSTFFAEGIQDEDRARYAVLVAVRYTATLARTQRMLPEKFYQALDEVVSFWCDVKLHLADSPFSELLEHHPSLVQLFNEFQRSISCECCAYLSQPEWNVILPAEIMAYPETKESVPLMYAAGKSLRSFMRTALLDRASEARCNVAIAITLSHSLKDAEWTEAEKLLSEVVTKLQLEDSNLTSQEVVILMEAMLNLFIIRHKQMILYSKPLRRQSLVCFKRLEREGPGSREREILNSSVMNLSCVAENKNFLPLNRILELVRSHSLIESESCYAAMTNVEAIASISTVFGQLFIAMEAWTLLYGLANSAHNEQKQLLALSMLVNDSTLEMGSTEQVWLDETAQHLRNSIDTTTGQDCTPLLKLYELCRAKSHMLAKEYETAAELLLPCLNWPALHEHPEQAARAHLLASELMVLQADSPLDQLASSSSEEILTSVRFARPNPSDSLPERDCVKLRILALYMESIFVMSNMSITNKQLNRGPHLPVDEELINSLSYIQSYMLASRVAQAGALLGQMYMHVPDKKKQLSLLMHWIERILFRHKLVKFGRCEAIGVMPVNTAECNAQCQFPRKFCSFCHNPIYQEAKVRFNFIHAEDQTSFTTLLQDVTIKQNDLAQALFNETWKWLTYCSSENQWIQLLCSPIELIKHRKNITIIASQIASGPTEQTARTLQESIIELQEMCSTEAMLLSCQHRLQLFDCPEIIQEVDHSSSPTTSWEVQQSLLTEDVPEGSASSPPPSTSVTEWPSNLRTPVAPSRPTNTGLHLTRLFREESTTPRPLNWDVPETPSPPPPQNLPLSDSEEDSEDEERRNEEPESQEETAALATRVGICLAKGHIRDPVTFSEELFASCKQSYSSANFIASQELLSLRRYKKSSSQRNKHFRRQQRVAGLWTYVPLTKQVYYETLRAAGITVVPQAEQMKEKKQRRHWQPPVEAIIQPTVEDEETPEGDAEQQPRRCGLRSGKKK